MCVCSSDPIKLPLARGLLCKAQAPAPMLHSCYTHATPKHLHPCYTHAASPAPQHLPSPCPILCPPSMLAAGRRRPSSSPPSTKGSRMPCGLARSCATRASASGSTSTSSAQCCATAPRHAQSRAPLLGPLLGSARARLLHLLAGHLTALGASALRLQTGAGEQASGEAGPLGALPLPRLLEPAASSATESPPPPVTPAGTTVFPSVDYAFTTIPTYPSGQIGFLMCSTSPNTILRVPARTPPPEVQAQLKYYNPAVHAASFVLPVFAEKTVAEVRRPRLPHVASSVAGPIVSRGLLVGAVVGSLVGSAAALVMLSRK